MLSVLLTIAMAAASTQWRWIAVSNTAISITGDVTFATTRMTFQNGQAMDLQYITMRETSVQERKSFGNAAHYRLYRITSATNPTLQNRNKLCGSRPTDLTVAYEVESASAETAVLAAFFTGATPPPQWQGSSTLCATYTYALK